MQVPNVMNDLDCHVVYEMENLCTYKKPTKQRTVASRSMQEPISNFNSNIKTILHVMGCMVKSIMGLSAWFKLKD